MRSEEMMMSRFLKIPTFVILRKLSSSYRSFLKRKSKIRMKCTVDSNFAGTD